ncbi:MAG TPA: ABC transporter permease [Gammaproteobacteria bacterium]|nr:ABC transporter permease [Gammaproteobacteria bacterium]
MVTAETQSSRLGGIAGWTGRRTLSVGGYVVDLINFLVRAFRDWARRGRVFNRATLQNLYGQIIFTGVDALPVITFLGLAVGLSITSQMLKLATAIGSESDVAALLTNIVGVELSSILTAIVLIGRSGSAIAVDLGSMKLRGEVEGLELLGINVNEFFVTPRIIGAAFAQFTLAVYFALVALFGGVFLNDLISPGGSTHQLKKLAEAIGPEQVILFMIKNLLFGIIIAGTACYHGLKVRASSTELPQQTQKAIVTGLVLVFATDGIIAVLS